MSERNNRQWRLAARPETRVEKSHFTWTEQPAPTPAEGEVLVRNVYLSIDPTNRVWMREEASYLPAIPLGDVMRGGTIGYIEESRHPNFAPGDIVQGLLGWQDYAVAKGEGLNKLQKGVPLTAYMGLLGHIGITAYFGLIDIGKPQAGETLVVSAAAGAVGSLVGQIGKILGLRVVGIAGSDSKCKWLTEELGFDGAINYKTENVRKRLRELCPNGIDIDFENVGGQIMDDVLAQINLRARIILCGLISTYNDTKPQEGPRNIGNLLMKRARMEGFIVLDYLPRAGEAMRALAGWLKEGKLQYRMEIVQGLENAPEAVNMLFDGGNTGKLAVQLCDEPA